MMSLFRTTRLFVFFSFLLILIYFGSTSKSLYANTKALDHVVASGSSTETEVVVVDRALSAPSIVVTNMNATITLITRYNCGSRFNYTDRNGIIWLRDTNLPYRTGGTPLTYVNRTTNTSATQLLTVVNRTIDLELYQSSRSGLNFTYQIPIPNVTTAMGQNQSTNVVLLKLHFVEMYWRLPNKRLFAISVENDTTKTIVSNYDIIRETGSRYTATSIEKIVPVTDGILNIHFQAHVDYAVISALEAFVVHQPLTPPPSPPVANYTLGRWIELDSNATISERHEACFVMVGTKAYLIGGRKHRPVNIYDTITGTWSNGTRPPVLLHHMQCVVLDEMIWIVGAWTGYYPKENNTNFIYIYHPSNNSWTTRTTLPLHRRRGSCAVMVVNRRIYVSHGSNGGHETGNHSVAVPWLDYYNVDTDTWVTNLPDAIYPRDHTGGAYLKNQELLCVSGGRDGGTVGWPLVGVTECYNLRSNQWEIKPNIPQVRAGAAYGASCSGGELFIAGGEGLGKAWNTFQVFNGTNWATLTNLTVQRHGTGLAVACNNTTTNAIYIASGSAKQGGGPEIRSLEVFTGF